MVLTLRALLGGCSALEVRENRKIKNNQHKQTQVIFQKKIYEEIIYPDAGTGLKSRTERQ